ncbi:unnamed protein product, partial [marine sediment metagenome]
MNDMKRMKQMADNSVDTIASDADWYATFKDENTSISKTKESLEFQKWVTEWAKESLRVLKPGGYLLAAVT